MRRMYHRSGVYCDCDTEAQVGDLLRRGWWISPDVFGVTCDEGGVCLYGRWILQYPIHPRYVPPEAEAPKRRRR